MYFVIGVLFIFVAIAAFWQAVWRPGIYTMFVATMGLFSVGYYALPLLVPDMSALRSVPTGEIDAVAGMSFLYFMCVLAGVALVGRRIDRLPRLRFMRLDEVLATRWWWTSAVAAVCYFGYIFTNDLTSYAAEDFVGSFEQRSPIAGFLGFFSTLALAVLCLNFAVALRQRRRGAIAVMLLVFAFVEYRLASGAQRLLFITPIFMIFVSLVGLRLYRLAGSTLAFGVVALLVISPFAVALREARASDHLRQVQTATVSYNEGFFTTTLRSIVDRSDLIYNMTYLKPYVDQHGHVGSQFYTSVLAIPVPRVFWANKPYVLSDNGRPDGEASILVWRLIMGPTVGSLTAFGSIVAYREGGWPAVILDGIVAGMLFGLCLGVFSRSGYIGRIFLPIAFVAFTVAKVPTSLFEAMAQVMTYLPVVLGLVVIEFVLAASFPRTHQPTLRQPVARTPVSS